MPVILADSKIPFLPELLPKEFRLHIYSSERAFRQHLKTADAVLVRTVIPIHADLFQKTPVKFVGSATAGFDHLDIDSLVAARIAWAYAPGCNAEAVAEYVDNCLMALRDFHPKSPYKKIKIAGVVGVGHVGSRVAEVLKKHGWEVRCYDPPRAAIDRTFKSVSPEALLDCDLLCVHASLTREGSHASFHLLNADFFKQLKKGCVLLNAARGEIVDEAALLKHGKSVVLCLDVWENEPSINRDLLSRAFIATPHIAGYSTQAKWNASRQVVEALCDFFRVARPSNIALEKMHCVQFPLVPHVLQTTSEMQRALLSVPVEEVGALFQALRNHYVLR